MSTIAASLVKELRDLTGAPMMDCKRALGETRRGTSKPRGRSCGSAG